MGWLRLDDTRGSRGSPSGGCLMDYLARIKDLVRVLELTAKEELLEDEEKELSTLLEELEVPSREQALSELTLIIRDLFYANLRADREYASFRDNVIRPEVSEEERVELAKNALIGRQEELIEAVILLIEGRMLDIVDRALSRAYSRYRATLIFERVEKRIARLEKLKLDPRAPHVEVKYLLVPRPIFSTVEFTVERSTLFARVGERIAAIYGSRIKGLMRQSLEEYLYHNYMISSCLPVPGEYREFVHEHGRSRGRFHIPGLCTIFAEEDEMVSKVQCECPSSHMFSHPFSLHSSRVVFQGITFSSELLRRTHITPKLRIEETGRGYEVEILPEPVEGRAILKNCTPFELGLFSLACRATEWCVGKGFRAHELSDAIIKPTQIRVLGHEDLVRGYYESRDIDVDELDGFADRVLGDYLEGWRRCFGVDRFEELEQVRELLELDQNRERIGTYTSADVDRIIEVIKEMGHGLETNL